MDLWRSDVETPIGQMSYFVVEIYSEIADMLNPLCCKNVNSRAKYLCMYFVNKHLPSYLRLFIGDFSMCICD